MSKKLFLLFVILAYAHAKITLNDINTKPPCRAKDFMIWQYLQQDITPLQADKAYKQLTFTNNKLLFLYAKKTADLKIKKTVSCKKRNDLINITDKECLKLAFSPYKTLLLSQQERKKLLKKIKDNKTKKLLMIQSEPFVQKAYKKYDADTVLTFFMKTPVSFREKNLDIYLDEAFVNRLSSSWKISQFVKMVVCSDNLKKLQLSLLNLKGKNLNAQTNFFLALNHLKHLNKTEAMRFLKNSFIKSKHQIHKDKSCFWMYLVSSDKKYLKKLLLSMDINIYTLYAHEVFNQEFDNYFVHMQTTDKKSDKNLQNPFHLHNILEQIKTTPKDKLFDLAVLYKQSDMIAIQSFVIQKAYDFKMHGYIMPYDKYLKGLSIADKALVYAIMRQESCMFASAISSSYALGLMQLMPFLVDIINKQCEKKVCYNEMFDPKKNIAYALKHLKWIKKSLYHPLFIAYAYNGGMGFFRRYLEKNKFSDTKYEPFLSMELMSNAQSREYGKKVLANYVMYSKIMGKDVSIVHLFDILKNPKKTDRFRG